MAGCSLLSSAAGQRRCGCCCMTTPADREPAEIVDFDPDLNRWGDIWSRVRARRRPGAALPFPGRRSLRARHRGCASTADARLIDPYAKALAGDFLPAADGIVRPPKCVVVHDEFDWQGDRHLRRTLAETVIYEMHVRGFTVRQVERRGPSRHLPGADREDSLPAIAGRHGGRVDAGLRVSRQRLPGTEARSGRPTGATTRWRFSPRIAATPSAPSPAARSASSRKWCWRCTGPASR